MKKVVCFVDYSDCYYDDCDWNSGFGIIVPEDFDEFEASKQWLEETTLPAKWKNQYGEGVTKKRQRGTGVSFQDWLASKYEKVELTRSDWW